MSVTHLVPIRQAAGTPATVICLHSSGSSGGQWSALREQLEYDVRVLSPDFHGHGAGPSWHGSDDDIVAADAAQIARIAESEPGDVHLVGHSYGGSIALRVALHHPRRVTSVTIYEPVEFQLLFAWYGRRRPASEVIGLAADMRRRLRSDDLSGAAARFVEYWGGHGAWQALSPKQQTGIAKRVGLITAQFDALANDAPRVADYRSLRAPVLMLGGSEMNAPIRRIGELLRLALPHSTFHRIPAIGHMGPITHPGVVARHIAGFVRKQVLVPSRLVSAVAA
jgi:pimeloyl-ACP methyl ester carboxylesterase